jgi:hypothetical protein
LPAKSFGRALGAVFLPITRASRIIHEGVAGLTRGTLIGRCKRVAFATRWRIPLGGTVQVLLVVVGRVPGVAARVASVGSAGVATAASAATQPCRAPGPACAMILDDDAPAASHRAN